MHTHISHKEEDEDLLGDDKAGANRERARDGEQKADVSVLDHARAQVVESGVVREAAGACVGDKTSGWGVLAVRVLAAL